MLVEEESEEMSTCLNQVVTSQPGLAEPCHIRKHITENFIIYQVREFSIEMFYTVSITVLIYSIQYSYAYPIGR